MEKGGPATTTAARRGRLGRVADFNYLGKCRGASHRVTRITCMEREARPSAAYLIFNLSENNLKVKYIKFVSAVLEAD